MARVGRFGRRRASGQNMSALIASLLREQRAAQDRAAFDAYNNGGFFQGRPMTDERMLSYIRERRNGFSTDDPLWDEWNNRLVQQEFAIGEQKITLAFREKHVGAGAVASFYRSQLSKIPKDSAFYREVAGRAAQWADSAAAAARGAARRRATAALNAREATIVDSINGYGALESFLTIQARRAGIIAGTMTLTDADASDLERLLNSGLTFDGRTVTMDSWRRAAASAYSDYGRLISVREQAGRATTELRDQRDRFLSQTVVRINAVDDRAQYEAARDSFLSNLSRAQGDPMTMAKYVDRYLTTLGQIRTGAAEAGGSNANDPEFIGALANEINALGRGQITGPTVTDLMSTTGEGVERKDAESSVASFQRMRQDISDLEAGRAYLGQEEPGGPLKVQRYATGANMDPTGRKGLGPEYAPSIVSIDNVPRQVMLRGTPVNVTTLVVNIPTARHQLEGEPVKLSDFRSRAELQDAILRGEVKFETNLAQPAGYIYQTPGGETRYGVRLPDGTVQFTTENPFQNLERVNGIDGWSIVVGSEQATTDRSGNAIPQYGAGLIEKYSLQNLAASGAPLLVDSTVAVADLEKYLGDKPQYSEYLARRRAEVEQDKQNRLEDARFLSNLRAGPNALPRESLRLARFAQESPLAAAIGEATQQIGNALKGLTLPTPPRAERTDLAAPPAVRNLTAPVPSAPPSTEPLDQPTLTELMNSATPTKGPGVLGRLYDYQQYENRTRPAPAPKPTSGAGPTKS